MALHYRRILLKLSGEALAGEQGQIFDPGILQRLGEEIRVLVEHSLQIGLVVGAGNILRGSTLQQIGFDHVRADHMGMLGTIINALALQDILIQRQVPVRLMSAVKVHQLCEEYQRERALDLLDQGTVLLLAGGTGNPCFTTDSAASLRAIELGADLLVKATKVEGIYSSDPVTDPQAKFFPQLSYDQVLARGLKVMDTTAIVLCRHHNMPLRVINLFRPGLLLRLVQGEAVGSLVERGRPPKK